MTKEIKDLIAEAREWAGSYASWGDNGLADRLVDALESVRAERDAALAAIERVREEHQPCYGCIQPHCFRCKEAKWPCATFRALVGAPEPEWEAVAEYGVKYAPTNNRASYTVRFGYESREDAEHSLGRLGRNQKRNPDRLMYREVRTGPWLPVKGESNDA